MKIKKVSQTVPTSAQVINGYTESNTDSYSANYQNAHNVVVSTTEPTNKSKVWLQSNGNIFDGVLEPGTITSNGTNADNNDRRRSKNYIKVKPSTTYTLRFNGQADTIVFEYNSSKTFIQQISNTWTSQPYTFTTSANTEYIRFISYNTTTTKALLKAGNQAPADEIDITDKTYILDDDNMYREYTPQNEIYSTTETKIGTWLNGKTLYRSVANTSVSITANTWTNLRYKSGEEALINCIISDCNDFKDANSCLTYPVIARLYGNYIQIYSFINTTVKCVIVEYTKTTD